MVEDSTFRRTVTVNLKDGLHLRPISQIVETVRRFGSPVRISKGELSADAGNVLDLIPLKIEFGTTLIIEATGDNAAQTLDALVALFESNFDDVPSSPSSEE
jgi:phosphotransferase system HPr (HPr) family protein